VAATASPCAVVSQAPGSPCVSSIICSASADCSWIDAPISRTVPTSHSREIGELQAEPVEGLRTFEPRRA
jgi:hypothetical protein